LSREVVEGLAHNAGISPSLELPTILQKLKENRLLDTGAAGDIEVIGLTTGSVLSHTADIFNMASPLPLEVAALGIAEYTSQNPVDHGVLAEHSGDTYKLSTAAVANLLRDSHDIGFIDCEELGADTKLYFNGNLFRRDNAKKTFAIFSSLSSAEENKLKEVDALFLASVAVPVQDVVAIIGQELFDKLRSIGMYDVNTVSNVKERVDFVTKPAAFGKYGNPLVEDALDLVKVFVTSLTYGMNYSSAGRGRISMLERLMTKLISGNWVGPATAIGEDYKVLEIRRVIQLRNDGGGRFSMRLLKKDVGELALQAIVQSDVSETSLPIIHGASIINYSGPERNREILRKRSRATGQEGIIDLLRTLRV
jgi:hypothetical protein